MRGTTHILGGMALMALTIESFDVEPIQSISSAIIGAILPDICHPRSIVGRRLPLLSHTINRLFGHRSITHSIVFILFCYWLLGWIPWEEGASYQIGVTIGIISHIILDALTPKGVQLFYPLKTFVRFPLTIKTGSMIGETIVSLVLLVTILLTLN